MMFLICGVVKPEFDVTGMISRGDDYATLASAAGATFGATDSAISIVAAHNDGPGVGMFEFTTGNLANHFAQLADAAQNTAGAYKIAAMEASSAQNVMTIIAEENYSIYRDLILTAKLVEAALLIKETRDQLLRVEKNAVSKIDAVFTDLALPGTTLIPDENIDGKIDSAIAEKWRQLSDEERKKILQKMADDFADRNGYPRIELTFKPIAPIGDYIPLGEYRRLPFKELRMNSDGLNDPNAINTVAHEMEHRGQYEGMGLRWPWQDERAGMSRVEAERWRELNQDHVRKRGGPEYMDYYPPRPVEVGGRRAGREFVNTMNYEDFQRYLR